jgi:hypothetical protein
VSRRALACALVAAGALVLAHAAGQRAQTQDQPPQFRAGVVVNAAPGLAFAAQPTMTTLLPIVPTTQRVFARTDRVNAIISNSTQTMPQSAFTPDTRAAGFEFPLPVSTLAPGPYVVTFEASTGPTTARRNVRFGIRQ